MKNSRRREHSQMPWIEWHPGSEGENEKTKNEKNRVKDQQGERILLPVLVPKIQALFEPPQDRQGLVFAVHDPGQIAAQRQSDESSRYKK